MAHYEEPSFIVKYHENDEKTDQIGYLNKAKAFMQNPSGRDAKYAVHVFRSAVDVREINAEKLIEAYRNSFEYVNIRKTSIEGFFINDKKSKPVNLDLEKLKDNLLVVPSTDELVADDYGNAVAIYEAAVNTIADDSFFSIYGRNMRPNSFGLPSILTDVPYNLNPDVNKDLDVCIGINTPTYYFGGHQSFTEIHPEDGYADSANVVHWGVKGAWKGWLIVHPDDNKVLSELLYEVVKELKTKGEYTSDICSTPINHKNLFVSPSFLKRNNVRYEIVIQRPGDLVYVDCLVYHQVINFGINLAEAVNVGSSKWNSQANHCIPCKCSDNCIVSLCRNRNSYETVKCHAANTYYCEVDNCPATFYKKVDYEEHILGHENPQLSKLICTICQKYYKTKDSLRKHIDRQHAKQKPICPICQKPQSSQNLKRHVVNCKKDKTCPFCKKICKSSGIGPHKARCSLKQ